MCSTGYLPVNKASFEEISHYTFTSDAYKNLYTALETVQHTGKMIQEPSFPNYYTKVSALYDGLREMQSQVFERQISFHFNNLAVMGIQLAEESDHIIAFYLKENALDFEQLNGSEIRLSSLQEALFDTLEHKLLEADCTGAFILLNAQVNPSVENASVSRSGLYLQRSSLDSSDNRILLYRGLAAIGKKQGCMPHRKWRLEFRTDHVPDFEHIKEKADLPLFSSYQLTDMFPLPGTSERVMLLALPLTGSDGTCFFCFPFLPLPAAASISPTAT